MICIRKIKRGDYPAITELIDRAFRHVQHNEYLSLAEMSDSEYFTSEMSLVAEIDYHRIVGHIYLTEISIDYAYPSLALVQVAVAPEFQRLGIGSMLMENAHQKAMELGYGSVISLGGNRFLSKFGYQAVANFGIHFPCCIVEGECLAVELCTGALTKTNSMVDLPIGIFIAQQ